MVFTERQKNELKLITKETSKEVLRELTSDDGFLDSIVDKLVNKIMEQISVTVDNMKIKISEIEKKVNILEEEKVNAQFRCNELEQQIKIKQLRIYGVGEKQNENLNDVISNIFATKMGSPSVTVGECYRLGRPKNGVNRPILATFGTMQQRNLIFFNKKKLKGSKIMITEELTKSTYELLLYAKENLGKENAWTVGGKIITKYNGKKTIIKSEEDVFRIIDANRN